MSEYKLNKNQIDFLKKEFSKNTHLKKCWNYSKWGTMTGVQTQIRDKINPIIYISTDIKSGSNHVFTHTDTNGIEYQYKIRTMRLENTGFFYKIKKLIRNFLDLEPKEVQEPYPDEIKIVSDIVDFLNKHPKWIEQTKHLEEASNLFVGEIKYITKNEKTYYLRDFGYTSDWVIGNERDSVLTNEEMIKKLSE